jgi:hypothetical protein
MEKLRPDREGFAPGHILSQGQSLIQEEVIPEFFP